MKASIISIHNFNPRSHKGSDQVFRLCMMEWYLFQSTLPQGERHPIPAYHLLRISISIHAPTRGATIAGSTIYYKNGFQSTLPQGERPCKDIRGNLPTKFQSTLPQGERRSIDIRGILHKKFQSTLPQGERQNTNCRP